MLPLDLIHHLGQAILHVPQGHRSIHTHSHKCSHIEPRVKISSPALKDSIDGTAEQTAYADGPPCVGAP
ncbi:hypothetical protein GCM10009583_33700 [Ornithinicoccus hortensis]